jgi:hypothetical protein
MVGAIRIRFRTKVASNQLLRAIAGAEYTRIWQFTFAGSGPHQTWSCLQEMICQFLAAWTMIHWVAATQKGEIDP